jgi:integrase
VLSTRLATHARVATKLAPAANGGWIARKRIPEDVQDAYQKLYRVRWEERFHCGPMTVAQARAQHREWLTKIEGRINNIRAESKGEGISLTPKDARALSGEWYLWYVQRHTDRPSPKAHWKLFLKLLTDQIFQGVEDVRDDDDPYSTVTEVWGDDFEAREPARAMAADWAETTQFLHAKRLTLSQGSRAQFLDCVCHDLYVALHLLIRRAEGDWREDTYPEEFPRFEGRADGSLTPMSLFRRWVAERQPAASAVDRWRGVFLQMEADFRDRSAASITPEEAQDWCRGLINEKRTATTVNEVWKSAARTVFGWAVGQRLLPRNPFENIKITVPKKVRMREGKAFSLEEIRIILGASSAVTKPETNRTQAVRRWIPWICAYSGARSGEIAQLRRQDVIQRDGAHAIRITPDAGPVKTGEPRTVPIHDHLIEQGFLEFVKSNKPGPLFYNEDKDEQMAPRDPTNPRKPRSVKAREHLAAWIRKLGVTDREIQPNHAWRHTFKQIGHRHGISERLLDAICGHASPTEGRGYGLSTLADMAVALKKFPRYEVE